METVEVSLPTTQLRTDSDGFNALGQLHNALQAYRDCNVSINCSRLRWMDAHLSAPFLTIIGHARRFGNKVPLMGLSDDVRLILQKNGLLKTKAPDRYRTTIPVTGFRLNEGVAFSVYSKEHLRRSEMPKMSDGLRSKFNESIDEIFANCALHSQSEIGVVAAGQFYPKNERLSFAISDGGRGVDGSLRASGVPHRSAADAIDWAMQSQNTTRRGDIPGGLGLKLLREFIAHNGGRLLVASSGGYWMQVGETVSKHRLLHQFPGTVVVMEISTSDRKNYDLAQRVDPLDIFR